MEQYLQYKAAQAFPGVVITENHIKSIEMAFAEAGFSAWDHYTQYGAGEGVNPSNSFDANAYVEAQVARINADPDVTQPWDSAIYLAALKAAGLNPVSHYYAYGQYELQGYVPPAVTGELMGKTQTLGTGTDSLFGGKDNDLFTAEAGTLQSADYLDGLGGTDTLKALLDGSNQATNPTIVNVEKIEFTAQNAPDKTGDNNPSHLDGRWDVAIDAGRIRDMNYLHNNNSRADLAVEDVRVNSSATTIALSNTDPGGVDFGVFFQAPYLTSQGQGATGRLGLELMDVKNSQAQGTHVLTDNTYDTFTIRYTDNSGNPTDLVMQAATGYNGTPDTLAAAFNTWLVDNGWADRISVAVDPEVYPANAGSGTDSWAFPNGHRIIFSSNEGQLAAVSLKASIGDALPSGGISWAVRTGGGITCPLIQTNLELDNVGQVKWQDDAPDCLPADAIYGSRAGDLVIGSMATTGGVERFDVVVDRGSWLNSMASTNNALRLVTVKNGDVQGDYDVQNAEGSLFVGASLAAAARDGNLTDWNTNLDPHNPEASLENPGSWIDMPRVLARNGLTDVKAFDASAMVGNVNIGAQLTAAGYLKYLADVDGLRTVQDNYAPSGDFVYNLGGGHDTLNLSVNGGLAADPDFKLNISGNDGDDFVNFRFTDLTLNENAILQAKNAAQDMHVTINGDAGADTVKSWGNGAVTVNGGAGNDAIYVGQNATDLNAVWTYNAGTADADKAIYIDDLNGAQSLNNDLLGTVGSFSLTGTTAGNNVFSVVVDFKGLTSQVTVRAFADGIVNPRVTALEVNKAIITAINTDPVLSKLLVAKDGAGYSLLIESLIDGEMGAGDLTISFDQTTTTNLTWVPLNNAYADDEFATVIDPGNPTPVHSVVGSFYEAVPDFGGTPAPATFTLSLEPTAVNGEVLRIVVNGETFEGVAAVGGTGYADVATAIANAENVDGDTIATVFGWTASDGTTAVKFTAGAEQIVYSPPTISVFSYEDYVDVMGTDDGTTSHNIVEGGSGDDVLVLNVASATPFIDIVRITSAFGIDTVLNFQTGVDKIDLRGLSDATGTYNVSTTATTAATTTAIATALNADNLWQTANDHGAGMAQLTGTDNYVVFTVHNTTTSTLDAGEITILGMATVADTAAALATTDLA